MNLWKTCPLPARFSGTSLADVRKRKGKLYVEMQSTGLGVLDLGRISLIAGPLFCSLG